MSKELEGKRIAIVATDGVERIELEEPRGALRGAGAQTEVLSPHPGEIQSRQFDLASASTIPVDRVIGDASPDDYDAMLLPGGTVNPDMLRINTDAMRFIRGSSRPASRSRRSATGRGRWSRPTRSVVAG